MGRRIPDVVDDLWVDATRTRTLISRLASERANHRDLCIRVQRQHAIVLEEDSAMGRRRASQIRVRTLEFLVREIEGGGAAD